MQTEVQIAYTTCLATMKRACTFLPACGRYWPSQCSPCTHRYTPDLIKGDLDSLRDDVRQYYANKVCETSARGLLQVYGSRLTLLVLQQGVPVERDGDQYATDLGKCIKALEALEAQSSKTVGATLLLYI